MTRRGRYRQRLITDVTALLSAQGQGDPHAASRLLPLVYDELRELAAQRLGQQQPGQTLQPMALVHEGWGPGPAAHVRPRPSLPCLR
jgi:ECF sigma factor